MRVLRCFLPFGLAVLLVGCNSSGTADMATSLDPTGVSGSVVGMARDLRPATDDMEQSGRFALGRIAPRLDAVAQGDLSRPNILGAVNSQIDQAMAAQTLSLATQVASAGVGAAMTGGTSLISSAPHLIAQAAGTGYAMSKMGEAQGQLRTAMATTEAERATSRVVPDEDRPAEARAILSVIDGTGRSASWQNPASGASGKVTIRAMAGAEMPAGMRCRMIVQEWRGAGGFRKGQMMACAEQGTWYDLS